MVKLSIIIPHYNSPDLLGKLLRSIPDKSEIEVIVIDDNSNEKTKKLNKLINNNESSNVRFLNNYKDEKGAGACRNIGIDHANGQWILFADADDYFLDEFYDIVSKYFKTNFDVVFFTPTSIYLDTGEKSDRHLNFKKLIDNYIEELNKKNELFLRYSCPVPWSKLIKNNFIKENNLKFDEVIASNDIMFSTKVGYYMDQFKVETEEIYCVTRNKGSLTVKRSEEVFDSRLSVYINKIKFLRDKLSKEESDYFTLTGQGFIFNSIKYRFGFEKVINVIMKFRENNIPLFDKKIFNPIYLFSKLINHYLIEKKNKKYISK